MATKTKQQTKFYAGDRLKVISGPTKSIIGQLGTIKEVDTSGRYTEFRLVLDESSIATWVSEKWVEAAPEEQPPPDDGLEFWEGDRVKGVSIDTDQAIEGIVTAVGRKYLRLDGDKRSIFKATAEILEPGERVISLRDADATDDEDEPVLPPKPGTRMSRFRESAKAISLSGATDDNSEPLQAARIDSHSVEVIPTDPQQRLTQLEDNINEGLKLIEQGKAKTWRAVHQIQADELWVLSGHPSFEAYCKARWGWERSNAYEVADAGAIVEELQKSGIPESELPASVSQTRELKKAPAEQRSTIFKAAAANGKPTAKSIKTAVAQLQPPVCKPSISPEEFNREMAAASAARSSGCHSCRHRNLTESGNRFSCRMEEFDEALERRTLGIREDWAEMNEGCKSFSRPESAAPNYPVPAGVLRLKPTDGGHEVFGLVLSHDRFCRLAKLARSLDGTLTTALFELIDQLPRESDRHGNP